MAALFSERFLLEILEHVAHPIFVKDRDYRFVFVNQACCKMTGYPASAILGKTDYDLFPREQADFFRRKDREMFESGAPVDIAEEPITDSSGQGHVLTTTKMPLRDGAGQVTHLVGIIHEITQLKRVEDKLRSTNLELQNALSRLSQSNERLRQLDRLKSEFLANVSHEFRTPLTLNLAPLEEMLAEQRDEADRQRMQAMYRNSLRLLDLVNNLLDFARMEAGRMEPHFVPMDIVECTRQLGARFESALLRKGIAYRFVAPAEAVQAYLDPAIWEKLLFNLLGNALKFTDHGSVEVRLSVLPPETPETGDTGGPGRVELSVSDTGIGIAPEDLPYVFERFHRLQPTAMRVYEGTGIGLALVSEGIKLHGGTVAVTSHKGLGTTFSVHLPLGQDHLPRDQVAAEGVPLDFSNLRPVPALLSPPAPEPAGPGPGTGTGADKGRPQILVLDDNADMRAYLSHLLSGLGPVRTGNDGVSGLQMIRSQKPDLVLADVTMPGMDGFELCQQIKSDPETAHVPLILLTARAELSERLQGLARGADDYVLKPFSPAELQARVRLQLSLQKAHQALRDHADDLELRLAERTRELREADRLKDEFLSVASHELRTPLGSLQLLLGAFKMHLRDSPQSATLMPLVERGKRLITRLNRLIGDMLDMSRIQQGKLSVSTRPVELGPLLREAVDRARGSGGGRHPITLEMDREVMVHADPDRLDQVFGNLLANAGKYAPESSPIRVISRIQADDMVDVRFEDAGPGIPKELHERVFERFYQVEAMSGRSFGGLGLGLYISRELMHAQGGQVFVNSHAGQGSAFHVLIPLAAAGKEA